LPVNLLPCSNAALNEHALEHVIVVGVAS